jgi:hypothetical protein
MAEICIGTYAGGIQMYTFRSTSDTIKPPPPISIIASENDKIKIQAFPNPFEHKINLKLIQNKFIFQLRKKV